MELFEVKVEYNTLAEETVKEVYLVNAVSFTDVEVKVAKEFAGAVILSAKKIKVDELMNVKSGADMWFKVRVAFALDEKVTLVTLFVRAKDFDEAYKIVKGSIGKSEEIFSIVESPVVDLIK